MDSMNQYYCQQCKAIHNHQETKGVIFKTGFIYVSAVKYPIGVCVYSEEALPRLAP